jgi:folylpolyglutamate synthase/dihydropteroate synthase
LNGDAYNSVADAVNAAREHLSKADALLVTGSFFIVGEALAMLQFENLGNVLKNSW